MVGRKARKRKLPKDFEKMLRDGASIDALKAVFETHELDARGGYSEQTAFLMAETPAELVRWLVAQGADTKAVDRFGYSALHIRAGARRSDLEVLIECGCEVTAARTIHGDTPLHRAAAALNAPALEVLLQHGARVDAKDGSGLTPLEVGLQQCSNIGIAEMVVVASRLLDAGAGKTPASKDFVRRIGETFEFHREGFNRELVDAGSVALGRLCAMFDVEPPSRRQLHDGNARIAVPAGSWQDQHDALWKLLVPSKGAAATAQGEAIRITARISREIEGNGGINWDSDYREMARMLLRLVAGGKALSNEELRECEAIAKELVNRKAGDTSRLAELAVAWVVRNPEPMLLGHVDYSR